MTRVRPTEGVDLPPVRVNTSAKCAAEDKPVRLIPGYSGFVSRSREVFGKTYGATTEDLDTGSRRSLFKLTEHLAKPDRVPLPSEHPQAVLQKTSWTSRARHDGSPPRALFDDAGMYETTSRLMQAKKDTTGTPEDDIRMIPGYSGHVHSRRETFGGTWGSTIRPLKGRPAPSTKSTLLTPRGHEGPMRNSKGLQVHSSFTVPMTPRDQTSIAKALRAQGKATAMRGTPATMRRGGIDDVWCSTSHASTAAYASAGGAAAGSASAASEIDLEVDDNGSLRPVRPRTTAASRTRAPPARPTYARPGTTGGGGGGGFEATSHRERLDASRAAAARPASGDPASAVGIPKADASAFRPPLVGKKPRNAKVVNSLFNVGRGGYMGQDAEKSASSFHVKNRPFGSQFKVHVPARTNQFGMRYDKM